MFKKAAIALALGMALSGTALADAWTFNYEAANAAEGYVPPANLDDAQSALIDELKFTAESLVVFTSGTAFLQGSTFTDYIVLRIDQANYQGDEVIDPINENNFDRQITAIISASGSFTADGVYVFSPTGFMFDVYYDAGGVIGTDGSLDNILSRALFNGLTGFDDGTLVENASLIAGGGVTTELIIPDGTIDLIVLMNNLLEGGFELFDGKFDPMQLVFGISDGNNNLCQADGGTAQCGSATMSAALTGFNSIFGTGLENTTNIFYTRSDGSFTKLTQAVPEPATLALMGMGLLGLGVATRRRKSA